jgi:hypothetical protein
VPSGHCRTQLDGRFSAGCSRVTNSRCPHLVLVRARSPVTRRHRSHTPVRRTHLQRQQVAYGKPASDLHLLAVRTMGAVPDRCAIIEDSPLGVTGAVAAGTTAIGFTAPGTCHPMLSGGSPTPELGTSFLRRTSCRRRSRHSASESGYRVVRRTTLLVGEQRHGFGGPAGEWRRGERLSMQQRVRRRREHERRASAARLAAIPRVPPPSICRCRPPLARRGARASSTRTGLIRASSSAFATGAAPGRVDSGADIDDVAAVHRRLLRVRKRRLDGRESPESGVALSAHDDRPGADLVEKSVTSGALIRPHRPSL